MKNQLDRIEDKVNRLIDAEAKATPAETEALGQINESLTHVAAQPMVAGGEEAAGKISASLASVTGPPAPGSKQ